MVANATTFVQNDVKANLAPYPGYYQLPNNFMKPNAAYAPRQIQLSNEIYLLAEGSLARSSSPRCKLTGRESESSVILPPTMKLPRISRRKFLGTAGAAATLTVPTLRAAASLAATSEAPSIVHVSIAAAPILFDPDQALGSSMDILSQDVVEKIYTEPW